MLPTIAVLITCHNRKEKTLICLQALFNQSGLGDIFIFEVFLVDDGSSDGTSEAIQTQFPEVNIIRGSGILYWNRGMHLAWETATKSKEFDYYLWLNDDTFLFNDAFKSLFKEKFPEAIICGTTISKLNNIATYGAYINKQYKLLTPNGIFQQSDYCNGNCVLIPKYVYEKVGNLDPIYHHALGDFDFSLRARKLGIEIYVAPYFIGFCENHHCTPKWRSNSLSVLDRLKNLYSPLSGCNPPEFFVFEKRHNGLLLAIQHIISLHIRCLFPQLYK
jgi:GT2 family glycosyltransferase